MDLMVKESKQIDYTQNLRGFENFGKRLATLMDGGTYKSFSEKFNLSDKALRDYVNGKTYPSIEKIAIMARASGCSFEWLATGIGKMKGVTNPYAKYEMNEPNLSIPLLSNNYADINGNSVNLDDFIFINDLGLGVTQNRPPKFTFAFRKDLIDEDLGINPKELAVMRAVGDSMSPEINQRDILLVHFTDKEPREGIYLLTINNEFVVKRIQRLPGSVLHITSANQVYTTFTVDLNNPPKDFSVVGKVVWVSHTT